MNEIEELEELFVKWLCSENNERNIASAFDVWDAKQTASYVEYLAQRVHDFSKRINIIRVMDELRGR